MNLYKMEWMKIRLSVYVRAALGIFVSLSALGILFLFLFQMEPEEAEVFASWNGLLALTTALSFACFGIWSAVVAAKVMVSEYCGRNAVVLLSYPINRRRMLGVKCQVVIGMTTVFAWVSQTMVMGIIWLFAHIFGITPQGGSGFFGCTVLLSGFLMGVLSSAAGVISAAFGWKKRSIQATIVCSLLIVCTLTNCMVISPDHMAGVMLAMGLGAAAIAGWIYQMQAKGIERMEV